MPCVSPEAEKRPTNPVIYFKQYACRQKRIALLYSACHTKSCVRICRLDRQIPLIWFNEAMFQLDELRFLGVTMDHPLQFGNLLRSIAIKAGQRIGFFRKASSTHLVCLLHTKDSVVPSLSPLVWRGMVLLPRISLASIGSNIVPCHWLVLLRSSVIVDSIRCQVSSLSYLFKLMCGPWFPALQQMIPPPLRPPAHPRTRRQQQSAHSFQLQKPLSVHSCNTIQHFFP